MAKLRKTVEFDVTKPDQVKAALADVEMFCGSGVPVGAATLVLMFDAPSLQTMRQRSVEGEGADDLDAAPRAPRVAKGA